VVRWMQSQKSSEASFLFSHKTLGGRPFPSRSPPRSKDREGKEQVGLKRTEQVEDEKI
jgi:hypothetical protein